MKEAMITRTVKLKVVTAKVISLVNEEISVSTFTISARIKDKDVVSYIEANHAVRVLKTEDISTDTIKVGMTETDFLQLASEIK